MMRLILVEIAFAASFLSLSAFATENDSPAYRVWRLKQMEKGSVNPSLIRTYANDFIKIISVFFEFLIKEIGLKK